LTVLGLVTVQLLGGRLIETLFALTESVSSSSVPCVPVTFQCCRGCIMLFAVFTVLANLSSTWVRLA